MESFLHASAPVSLAGLAQAVAAVAMATEEDVGVALDSGSLPCLTGEIRPAAVIITLEISLTESDRDEEEAMSRGASAVAVGESSRSAWAEPAAAESSSSK
jgi:hypothetical protein